MPTDSGVGTLLLLVLITFFLWLSGILIIRF